VGDEAEVISIPDPALLVAYRFLAEAGERVYAAMHEQNCLMSDWCEEQGFHDPSPFSHPWARLEKLRRTAIAGSTSP
jgi:hypothetical protein